MPCRSATITSSSFAISPMLAYVGQLITFTATASSNESTNLTFTIYYDFYLSDGSTPNPESPVSVNVTGNPGQIRTEFVYDAPRPLTNPYRVRLSIDDGTGAPLKNITRAVTILENTVPYFAPDLEQSITAYLDNETFSVSLNFSVTCWDDENDNLTLTWDFGDGTEPVVEWTGPALMGVECTQNHTWSPNPELWYGLDTNITYYMNLSLTDGIGHWTNTSTLILMPLDHNFSPTGNVSASSSKVDPADVVTIYGNASDAEGEPLTWTFVFKNATEIIHTDVYRTELTEPGARVFQNTSYVFSVPGNYSVTLYLSDLALPELQTDPDYAAHNRSVGKVDISCVNNRIPEVLATIQARDYYTGSQDVTMNTSSGLAIAVLSIEAVDRDGEVLYATWDFGDGTEPASNQSSGGALVYEFVQVHEFPSTGQFNVSVVITDGRPGHDVLRCKLLNITSASNRAPEIREFNMTLSNSSYGFPGSVVQFVVVLYDLERDPLEVRWDFGDGSPIVWSNVTSFDENGNVTCTMEHIYSEVGTYKMWVNVTDRIYGFSGLHREAYSSEVVIAIYVPKEIHEWDTWDYASLGIFFLMIGLLILWGAMGSLKRRRFDQMGMTIEEYLLRKQEMESFDERHTGGKGLK